MKKLYTLFILWSSIAVAQNNPPVANYDSKTIDAGKFMNIIPMSNDSDPDGNTISLDTFLYTSGKGKVSKLNAYVLKYTADSFFYGLDTILYVICDSGTPSLCDTGIIFVVVNYKFYDSYEYLDINNVSARFNTGGSNFWDMVGSPGFEVPKGTGTNSIFAESVWIGGKDDANGLHLAAQRFKDNGEEFYPGPIMDSTGFPPGSYSYQYEINKWNRMWKVNKSDIDYHITNWNQPGYVIPQVFLDWPAHGDTSLSQEYYLAPFYDYNSDGKYNPSNGDYPIIKGDQTVYFIYNDNNPHEQTGGTPLKVEVHGTAYSFNCSDSALQHTVFVNYKFFNRSLISYHDTYLGLWMDVDLGNYMDDYVGCDIQRGGFYFYNGDEMDEDYSGTKGYGNYPPAQSAAILAGPFQDFDGIDNPLVFDYYLAATNNGIPYPALGIGFSDTIIDNERIGMTTFMYHNNNSGITGDPELFSDYYNYMRGYWKDGTQMVYDEGTVPAKYMLPGSTDPLGWGTGGNPQASWSEITAGNTPADRRGLSATGPFTFEPGETEEFDVAFVFGRDYQTTGAAAGVTVMNQRIDAIREMFANDSTPCGGKFSTDIQSQISYLISHISIYPNPVSEIITISFSSELKNAAYEIYDLMGRKMEEGKLVSQKQNISLRNFSNGVYLLRMNEGERSYSKKFVKN